MRSSSTRAALCPSRSLDHVNVHRSHRLLRESCHPPTSGGEALKAAPPSLKARPLCGRDKLYTAEGTNQLCLVLKTRARTHSSWAVPTEGQGSVHDGSSPLVHASPIRRSLRRYRSSWASYCPSKDCAIVTMTAHHPGDGMHAGAWRELGTRQMY